MSRTKWQDAIPEGTIRSFWRQYKHIVTVLPRMGGWMFSAPFESYCEVDLAADARFPLSPRMERRIISKRNALIKKRDRIDPVLVLFKEWGDAERAPDDVVMIEDELFDKAGRSRIEIDTLYMPPHGAKAQLQAALTRNIKNITSLLASKHTVDELATLACLGDDQSLFRLIELDKIFLTAKFARQRIRLAQANEDRQFFRDLARSVRVDAYRRDLLRVRVGIACYLLWFSGFRRLNRDELMNFLASHSITAEEYSDPQSFYNMLNRIGLRKYRKVSSRKL